MYIYKLIAVPFFIYTYPYILFHLLFCFVSFFAYIMIGKRGRAAERHKDESVTEIDGPKTSRIMLQISTSEIFLFFVYFSLDE